MRRSVFASFAVLWSVGTFFALRSNAQATYTLKPTAKTVAWGYYDAKAAPVLHVKSGDTVEIQTLITSSPKRLEDAGVPPDQVEQSLRDITAQVTEKVRAGTSSRVPFISKMRSRAMCSKSASRKSSWRFRAHQRVRPRPRLHSR